MRLLLLKAWPALIPIGLYLIWLLVKRAKAKRAGEPLPPLLSGPWLQTLGVSLVVFAICLFYLGLSADHNAGASFSPQRFEDGHLIEEQLK